MKAEIIQAVEFLTIKDLRIRKASLQSYAIIESEDYYYIHATTSNSAFEVPCDSKEEADTILMQLDSVIL